MGEEQGFDLERIGGIEGKDQDRSTRREKGLGTQEASYLAMDKGREKVKGERATKR